MIRQLFITCLTGIPWVLCAVLFAITVSFVLVGFVFVVGKTLGTIILGVLLFVAISLTLGLIIEDSNDPLNSHLSRWL